MAEYYGKEASMPLVEMYADDFEQAGCTLDQVTAAWKIYRRDPKNERFPLPSKLIAILNPVEDDRGIAERLVSTIITAVGRNGRDWGRYYEPDQFYEILKKDLGDLAFEVIRQRGGWYRFCTILDAPGTDMNNFRAQLRDEIQATLKAAKVGSIDSKPGLPASNKKVMDLVSKTADKLNLNKGVGNG